MLTSRQSLVSAAGARVQAPPAGHAWPPRGGESPPQEWVAAPPGSRPRAAPQGAGAQGRSHLSQMLSTSFAASCSRSVRSSSRTTSSWLLLAATKRWRSHRRSLGSSAAFVAPAAHVERDFVHLALRLRDPRSWDAAAEQVLVAGQAVSLLGGTRLVPGVLGAEPARAPRGGRKVESARIRFSGSARRTGATSLLVAATAVSVATSRLFSMSCTGWPPRYHHRRSLPPLGPLH